MILHQALDLVRLRGIKINARGIFVEVDRVNSVRRFRKRRRNVVAAGAGVAVAGAIVDPTRDAAETPLPAAATAAVAVEIRAAPPDGAFLPDDCH